MRHTTILTGSILTRQDVDTERVCYDYIMPSLRSFLALISFLALCCSLTISPALAQQTTSPSVSLTVPLRSNDIALTLSRIDGKATTEEGTFVTYQITYSSLLSYNLPITLQASWGNALIQGSSVQLADYVTDSATNAYNNTPPIIDPLNKTITWNIPSLPAHTTDETVSFRIVTNSNYIGTGVVSFPITALGESNGQSLTPVTLTQYYVHTQSTPSSSSSSPSSPPAPTSVPTQAPKNTSSSLISGINVQTISSKAATAYLTFPTPSTLTIRYGTSPSRLASILKVAEAVSNYTLTFPDLLPKTTYYFTITAQAGSSITTSDIYTFTTAKADATSFVDLSSLIITSDNLILTSSTAEKDSTLQKLLPTAVITINTPYEFRFVVSQSDKIKTIEAIVRDANVLGINTFTSDFAQGVSMNAVQIAEIAKGVYSGRLKTALLPGKYIVFAHISDESGNITEQPLATVTVVKPLTVLEAGTKKPIENARVLIYRKHPRTNQYTLLSEQAIPLKNPVYTEPDGTIDSNLIQGDYKIHVSATGYTPVDRYFTISPRSDNQYPTVYLTKHGFSISSTIQYYTEAASDLLTSFSQYLETVGISHRLFNLVSLIALCFFIIVTTLSFCLRFHIPVSALPAYFFAHLHLHQHRKSAQTISGVVVDEKSDGFPIEHAIIYLLDRRRKRILLHTQTNKLGQFTFLLPVATSYLLLVKKRNYVTREQVVNPLDQVTLSLQLDPTAQHPVLHALQLFCMNMLGLCFEILLFLSFALEVMFSMSLGIVTVLPYILVTLLNLLLWLVFVKNQRSMYTA